MEGGRGSIPDLVADRPAPRPGVVVVNEEFAEWDTPIGDGDRVVFIPPVAGG